MPFERPSPQAQKAIAEKLLQDFCRQVEREGRSLQLDEQVAEYLCGRWKKDGYGVRSLLRTIDRELADPLARLLAEGAWTGRVRIVTEADGLKAKV